MGKRLLDDSLLTSPSLAGCSPRAQDAFPRFILLADDFGCFDANPRVLLGRGWSLRPDVTAEELSGWLEEYRTARPDPMLQLWADGGRTYGHLLGWLGPHGQRRREEYSATNPKGSRRRTPAPPPFDAKSATSLPAPFPPGKREIPPGQSGFPPLHDHDQSHDQLQEKNLAGAVAPAGTDTSTSATGATHQNPEGVGQRDPVHPPPPAEISRPGVTSGTPGGDSVAPEQAELVPGPKVEELQAAWNELTSPPLPRWEKTPPDRRKSAQNALKRRGLEDWREVFRRIEADGFMRGENDRGWVADIDYAIRPAGRNPEPAAKILERPFPTRRPSTRAEDQHHSATPGVYGG